MAKMKFIGTWDEAFYSDIYLDSKDNKTKLRKKYMVLLPEEKYLGALGKLLRELNDWQKKKALEKGEKTRREMVVELEWYYRNRTIDQNALLFSLYQIEATEQNAGMMGDKKQMVDAKTLYYQDSYDYNPRYAIECKDEEIIFVQDNYYVMGKEDHVIDGKRVGLKLECAKRTSKFNTKEFSVRIEMVFNRLAMHGVAVTNPGEILKYWHDHRQFMNDNKVILDDEIFSQDEYRKLHPICEACGTFIGHGLGELHHINAKGMGGKSENEPEKNYGSNWLHLCKDHHVPLYHQKGLEAFLKFAPHLIYKVRTAVRREYSPLTEWVTDRPEDTPNYTEKPIVETKQTTPEVEKPEEEEKIDPNAIVSDTEESKEPIEKPKKHVWYHPESDSIFIDTVPGDIGSTGDELIIDLGECRESEELRKNILEAVSQGVNKAEACTVYEQLGWDATDIDPDWIGIF